MFTHSHFYTKQCTALVMQMMIFMRKSTRSTSKLSLRQGQHELERLKKSLTVNFRTECFPSFCQRYVLIHCKKVSASGSQEYLTVLATLSTGRGQIATMWRCQRCYQRQEWQSFVKELCWCYITFPPWELRWWHFLSWWTKKYNPSVHKNNKKNKHPQNELVDLLMY